MTNLIALPSGTELVGDYRIERVLGAGGFGVTYLADEIALARLVTIKEYFPSDIAARTEGIEAAPRSQDCAGDYRWGLDRFIEEAQTLAKFNHPNIVRVYRYFRANNTGYMVLHFEEGQSLKAWLKALGRAPRQKELDAIIAPLLDALELIHKSDFLHRDIAPDNIIIRKTGDPVLIDFGSARGEIASHTKTVSALVKPGYSPYEQYAETSRRQGPWTDIYALGATLYHAVTGKRPPDAPSRMVNDELVPAREAALGSYRAGLPEGDRPRAGAQHRGAPAVDRRLARRSARARPAARPAGSRARSRKRRRRREAGAAGLRAAGRGRRRRAAAARRARPQGRLLDLLDGMRKKTEPVAAPADPQPRGQLPRPRSSTAAPAPKPQKKKSAPQEEARRAGRAAHLLEARRPRGFWHRRQHPSRGAQSRRQGRSQECNAQGPRARARAQRQAAAAAAGARQPPALDFARLQASDRRRRGERRGRHAGPFPELRKPRHLDALEPERGRPRRPTSSRRSPRSAPTRGAVNASCLYRRRPLDRHHRRRCHAQGLGRGLPLARAHASSSTTGRATALALFGTRAVTGHADGKVVLWDLGPPEKLATLQRNDASIWRRRLRGRRNARRRREPRLEGGAVGCAKQPSAPLHVFEGHETAVQALAYSPERMLLASGSADKTVRLWNLQTLSAEAPLPRHPRLRHRARLFAQRPHASPAARSTGACRCGRRSPRAGCAGLPATRAAVAGLAFAPDGDVLASAGDDGTVRSVGSESGPAPMRALTGHTGGATAVAFAPDGQRLASAGENGVVRLWAHAARAARERLSAKA